MKKSLFVRTIPSALNWLALAATTVLLVKIFWLNTIPELLPGLSQLGLIFEGVLASVLASYFFYLIVVHYKETKDRKVIYPSILKWARSIVGACEGQLSEFSKHTNHITTLSSLSKQDIEVMFQKIAPYSNAPLAFDLGHYANWMQYFEHYKSRSKRSTAKIMEQLVFLEAPLVAHLTKVDDCNHFMIVEMLLHRKISNTDLSSFADTFFDYCVACRELDAYLKSHAHS